MDGLKGFTLPELLTVIAITAISSSVSIHGYRHLINNVRAIEASTRISQTIQQARHAALHLRRSVGICPSHDGVNCGGTWSDSLLVFIDENRSQNPSNQTVLQLIPAQTHGTVSWSSFRGSSILVFNSNGLTLGYNGTFIYCPTNKDMRYAKGLVLNKSGRLRTLKDTDGDGIPNKDRANIRCA